MTRLSVALAVVGVVCIAGAGFLASVPLGLLVVGTEALTGAYVIRYLEVRR